MKVVRIALTYFSSGVAVYEGGKFYPLDAETQRQVDVGNGEIVEASDDVEKAISLAEKAKAKAAVAETAAADASAAAEAAQAADAVAVLAASEAAAAEASVEAKPA
jgi:hypothetical protein